MCSTRLAKMQDQKIAKNSPSGHHRTTLSGYIFATKACINNRKKNWLNSNVAPTCPHNMVNFGPLAAEICWLNGFHILAALLHGTLVVGVSQTAVLNRRRHQDSTGRPSRWALAHILVLPDAQIASKNQIKPNYMEMSCKMISPVREME